MSLPIALILAFVNPTFAQDASADQAKAMLKQGLDEFKAMEFKSSG